jgi:hypothetical protein
VEADEEVRTEQEVVEDGVVLPSSDLRKDRAVPPPKRKLSDTLVPDSAPPPSKKSKTEAKTATVTPEECANFIQLSFLFCFTFIIRRLAEYPGRGLYTFKSRPESETTLRCSLCLTEVDHTRKDSTDKHLKTSKHIKGESEKATAVESGSTLLDFGVASKTVPIGEGANFPQDHKKWRLLVLSTFLKAGVAINKIDEFRELLEMNSRYSLTSASHLSLLIPNVVEAMKSKNKSLTSGRFAVILFDGTPHIGDVISIIVRFWNGRLRQRMLDFVHLNKSPTAAELTRVRFPPLRLHTGPMFCLGSQQSALERLCP